jgi:tetratricopeptide (TPR) repeat protein/DNA-binding CsgD family transcriptional regulator
MYTTFRATPGRVGVALRLLFLLVYPVLIAHAASTPRMDSLRTALGRAGHDTSRVGILNQLSYCAVQAAQLEQAIRFARQALAIARKTGYQPGIGNAWSNLGLTYVYQSQYAASIKAYDHALAAFRKSGSAVDQANVLYTTSFNYINQGDYAMALQCNLAALRLLEKQRSPGGRKTYADVLVALAKVYKHQHDFGKALHFTGRALEAYVATQDSVGMVAANVEMGLIHRELTNLHLSVQYSREALAMIVRLAGNGERYAADAAYLQYLKQDARRELAQVSVLRGEFSAAIPLLEEALHYYREAGSPGAVAQCYVSVAEAYRGLGAYGRAHACLAEGIRMAQAVAERQVLLEGYQVLAGVYQDQGQYGRALRVTQRRSSLKDSLHEAQSRRQLVALESQYENHRKEQQLAESRRQVGEMRRERQITRLQLQLLLVVMVGLAVTGWLLFRQYRLRHRRNLARETARQAALAEKQARDEAQLERLHGELALKHREFTSQSLHLLQKNQGLNSKLEEIADLTRNAGDDALERVHRLVKSAEGERGPGKDWEKFRTVFEGVHPAFFSQLQAQYPALTPADLRLCALLKLNFTSKDVAAHLGISEESVRTARYRLRKKFRLEPEANLVDFLMKMG